MMERCAHVSLELPQKIVVVAVVSGITFVRGLKVDTITLVSARTTIFPRMSGNWQKAAVLTGGSKN